MSHKNQQQQRIFRNLIALHLKAIIERSTVMDSIECEKRLKALEYMTTRLKITV